MELEVISTALEDLKDIYRYIADVLNNPIAAERIVKKIRQSFSLIASTPFIGQSAKNKINSDTKFRFLTCGKYLIFYVVEEKRITINRVIYGKRDYIQMLFKSDFKAEENDNED